MTVWSNRPSDVHGTLGGFLFTTVFQQIKMASLKISQAIDAIMVTPTGIEPVFLA
jgi:hypothetical protein